MRAWAIWGTQKRVASILIWSYVSYVLVLTGTATYSMTTGQYNFSQLDVARVCIGEISSYAWLICCGSLILDTVLFALTMRSLQLCSREFQCLYPSDLLHLLVRDAIVFYIVSTLSNALSIASWTAYAHNPKQFIAKGFATPLLSVAGQRLVLNLRGLKGRTYTTQDLSFEVDRQLEAFAAADSPCRDDVGLPEGG